LSLADRKGLDAKRLLWLLLGLCAVLIAVGAGGQRLAGQQRTPTELVLGDVSEAHVVEIRDSRGVAVLSGEFRSRVDVLGNVEKDAALYDRRGRTVIGEVELEIPAPGRANRRPELEVDIIGLPASSAFTVVIDDRGVGKFTTDDRGSVDLEIQEGELPAPFSQL